MFRPRWRKVLSDLWENKVRTLLVIASIAVGVFAVGMIAGAYQIILQDMNGSYAMTNPANIILYTDPFDEDLIKAVERIEDVAEAEGRQAVNVRVQTGENDWISLELVAVEDFSQIHINQLVPVSGEQVMDDHEVIIEDNKKLSRLKAEVGDILQIELEDGTVRSLPFVGTTQDQTRGIYNLVGQLRGYVTYETLEWLHSGEYFTQMYVTVSEYPDDKVYIRQVKDIVTNQLERSGRQVYRSEDHLKSKHPMDSLVAALLGVMFILGVLVVFLSSSLITNTLSALLNQHLRHIGIMKLVGARSKQINLMYLVMISIFGLLALMIALPLSGWAAYELAEFAGDFIGFRVQGFRMIRFAVILQVIIAIFVPPVAGMLPVMKGSRITVVKAINSAGIDSENRKKGWLDRFLENLRGVSRPLLISLRNTFRRKGRLALTLLTLTLGGAVFISVFNVQASLNDKIERTIKYFMADVNLDLQRLYRNEAVIQTAMELEGVTDVECWSLSTAELLDENDDSVGNVTVFGPPAESQLIDPIILDGRWLLPGDEFAITVNEAFWDDYPDLKAGDVLHLRLDGKEEDWRVVGIFQYTGVDELFAYTTYEFLSEKLNQANQSSSFRIVTEEHSDEYQEEMSVKIDQHFRENGFHIEEVEAGNSVIGVVTDYIGILTAVLLIMALLTALVGSIGLMGTLSMNVLERTREIGIMRAIGAHNKIVMRLVITEGLLIGMISYLLGALLSFPITDVLADVVSEALFNAPADFVFTPQGFLIWLAAVVVLSVISSVIPARNASQMTIREVLSYD